MPTGKYRTIQRYKYFKHKFSINTLQNLEELLTKLLRKINKENIRNFGAYFYFISHKAIYFGQRRHVVYRSCYAL